MSGRTANTTKWHQGSIQHRQEHLTSLSFKVKGELNGNSKPLMKLLRSSNLTTLSGTWANNSLFQYVLSQKGFYYWSRNQCSCRINLYGHKIREFLPQNPSDVIHRQSASTCPKSPAPCGDFAFQVTSLLIPKGNKGGHHTSVKFGNVSKTTDYPEISWSSHNLLVLDANPKCNYAFGVFLFCFNYNNLYTIHKFFKKVFLLIYVLIRIEGLTILQKNQVVPQSGNVRK